MNLISAEYIIMLAISLCIYYFMPNRYKWCVLGIFSFVMISLTNTFWSIGIVIIECILTWCIAIAIDVLRKTSIRKGLLIISLLTDISGLLVFKYYNFFIINSKRIVSLFGVNYNIDNISILAPLGISYYTLVLICYVLEVYWQTDLAEKNILKFFTCAFFFPLLYSGPIIKISDVKDRILSPHRFSYKNLCWGTQRILWGFFKKLVVSDRLGVVVGAVYDDIGRYRGFYIIIAVVLFILQLYTDFSGCMDIVLGTAELFGIELPENFNLPFISSSISEFWRRWHITLGGWLRDYILYPILKSDTWQILGQKSKNRFGKKYGKKLPVWLGLFISWFLIGFWHGGGWNYIFGVGIFMWMVIVFGEVFESIFERVIHLLKINTTCFSWKAFQIIRTFCIVAFGNSFFRANKGVMQGFRLWRAAFLFNPHILYDGSLLSIGLTLADWIIITVSMFIIILSGVIKYKTNAPVREWLDGQNLVFRWALYFIVFWAIIAFGYFGPHYSSGSFIYQQF